MANPQHKPNNLGCETAILYTLTVTIIIIIITHKYINFTIRQNVEGRADVQPDSILHYINIGRFGKTSEFDVG